MRKGSLVPPGWYPDPYQDGMWRWWDGHEWTVHQHHWYSEQPQAGQPQAGQPQSVGYPAAYAFGPGTYAATGMPPVDGLRDLASARSIGKRASMALALAVPLAALQQLLAALIAHDFGDGLRRIYDAAGNGDATPQLFTSDRDQAIYALLQLTGLGTLVIGILFLVWLHRAATFAQRAHLPAARSTVWVVLGFIVPIVNFWFPYQVVRDVFPAGTPERERVKRWWALYLLQGFGGSATLLAGLSSTGAAIAVGALAVCATAAAAVNARRIIADASRVHGELLGRGPLS